jgi:PTH1 family peptidyl-tRNA hydrolase
MPQGLRPLCPIASSLLGAVTLAAVSSSRLALGPSARNAGWIIFEVGSKLENDMAQIPKRSGPWLIFALGNPGEEYENSYHNAGILALPRIAQTLALGESKGLTWKNHKRLFAYAPDGEFIFAKSLVFMNESGAAAVEAAKKFVISPEHLVVVQDDSDITLGDFKISFDRSSGGHKGAQSVIDRLKTQAFWRVRIGVRPVREAKRKKAGDFVLAPISPNARKKMESVFRDAGAALMADIRNSRTKAAPQKED